jgi:hypothetical protein
MGLSVFSLIRSVASQELPSQTAGVELLQIIVSG